MVLPSAFVAAAAAALSITTSSGRHCHPGERADCGVIWCDCYKCGSGQVSPGGSKSKCEDCSAGKYSDSGDPKCYDCSAGKYSDSGYSQCYDCPTGKYSGSDHSQCYYCSAGKYSSRRRAGDCQLCSAGKYSKSGYSQCKACSAGQHSKSGADRCSLCSPGKYSSSGSSQCYDCSAGKYSSRRRAGDCQLCSAGKYSKTSSDWCEPCPAGKLSAAGAPQCEPCPAGKHSIDTGASKCDSCTAGRYSHHGFPECKLCPRGNYSNKSGAHDCDPCPQHQWTAEKGATTCSICPYVSHAIDTDSSYDVQNLEDCLKLPTWPSPLIQLASTSQFTDRESFAKKLTSAGVEVNMVDSGNVFFTPIVALVQNCATEKEDEEDKEDEDRLKMMSYLVQKGVDTITGAPAERARDRGCSSKWQNYLLTNQQGLDWKQKWKRSIQLQITLPVLGPFPSLLLSVISSLLGGSLLGYLYVRRRGRIDAEQTDAGHRGALHLAATALYSSSREWLHWCMCFLSVTANIVFPMHLCMIKFRVWISMLIYVGLVFIPAVHMQGGFRLDKLACTALPVGYSPNGRKGKAWLLLFFHTFSAVRTLGFFVMTVRFADDEENKTVTEVTWGPFSWWLGALQSLSALLWKHPPLPGIFQNENGAPYRDPYHLSRKQTLETWVVNINNFPTRGTVYTFEACLQIGTVIWCVITLLMVLWLTWRRAHKKAHDEGTANLVSTEELAMQDEERAMEEEEGGPLLKRLTASKKLAKLIQETNGNKEELAKLTGAEVEWGHARLCLLWQWEMLSCSGSNCHGSEAAATQPEQLQHLQPQQPQRSRLREVLAGVLPSSPWSRCLRFTLRLVLTGEGCVDLAIQEKVGKDLLTALVKMPGLSEDKVQVRVADCNVFCEVGIPKGIRSHGMLLEVQRALFPFQVTEGPTIVDIRHVKPVGWFDLRKTMFLVFLDMFTDALQIYNFYQNGDHIFGGVLLGVYVASLWMQLSTREIFSLWASAKQSIENGYKSDLFLSIADREAGFEGYMSLALSCFALHWQIRGVDSCATGLLSIMVSIYGIAGYIYNLVFLEV